MYKISVPVMNCNLKRNGRERTLEELKRFDAERVFLALDTYELDTEKREFNGFIPKGITVETPIMLLERPIHRLLDLFCLDLAALSVRFSGFEDTTVTELEKYVLAFIKNARDARISVSVSSEASLKLLGELCHKADIHEVYTTRHLISEVRKLL